MFRAKSKSPGSEGKSRELLGPGVVELRVLACTSAFLSGFH